MSQSRVYFLLLGTDGGTALLKPYDPCCVEPALAVFYIGVFYIE